MGNCSPKGIAAESQKSPDNTIRVLTDSGTVLYLEGPKLVQEVVEDFPGYGIFRQGQGQGALSSHPLPHNQNLSTSQLYHLLPLKTDGPTMGSGRAGLEVLRMPRRGDGVWKVKLVIDPKQLEEIMSQEVNLEALIERMREAATSRSSATTQSPRRGKGIGGSGSKPSLGSIFGAGSC
ncbi:hypothetical protein SAY87_021030 [Trapa incisa]|uniref:Uncharacterized protein n=1 Tax=Trapa incisa TaxID=236973 RepID=A0AAN7JRE6_9MYRT|nr:hypothetical protein SAY87_021030 [Trapa incisa]